MGIKPRPTADPTAARPHAAGAAVTVLHHVEHDTYGTMGVPKMRFWLEHINIAVDAINRFAELHPKLLEADVRVGTRVVNDAELISALYRAGVECVLNCAIAVQHLCEEIEEITGAPVEAGPLRDRLLAATHAGDLGDVVRIRGYDGLVELLGQRDAIEHPKPGNTFANIFEWDRVPFAWMLGGRLERSFDRFDAWFRALVDRWDDVLKSRPTEVVTFEGVTRGSGSSRSFKKPPRTRSEGSDS